MPRRLSKMPEGAAYKSTYIYGGETLDNPLSGCVCPGGKIADGGGCVCPSGLIETIDGQSCVADMRYRASFQRGQAKPPMRFGLQRFLRKLERAILISGKPPIARLVSGLVSGLNAAGEDACRCPNNGFIQRQSDGTTYECAAACASEYQSVDPSDSTLKSCVCPGSQIPDGGGQCVCPTGMLKTAKGQDCTAACPSGQVSDGDATNPQCILDCRTHLDGLRKPERGFDFRPAPRCRAGVRIHPSRGTRLPLSEQRIPPAQKRRDFGMRRDMRQHRLSSIGRQHPEVLLRAGYHRMRGPS